MCGFLGEFTFHNHSLISNVDFQALLGLSKHRGPDNTSVFKQDNYQIGFNRLAIQDISDKGNQPMLSPSKRYVLVFNGEIYNFKMLKKKYQFNNLISSSDTEIILLLLDQLGVEKTLQLLNGMYSISIVDTKENTLILARDFAGIKPLFYGKTPSGIVFASQFDQVFKHPWFKPDLVLRPEIMKEYFGFGYMQAPNTIYKHIYQVNPGEYILVSSDGVFQKKRFLEFPKEGLNIGNRNAGISYNRVLENVVEKQLISDVPIATFLSGGVDSPLISAVAKSINPKIASFTFGVEDKKYDESDKAVNYAKHLQVEHTVTKVKEQDLLNGIDEHFMFNSEPFGDYSSIPTYLLTKEARKSHKVMLSGDGGDELFFGYPRMLDVLQKRHWFLIPYVIRKPLVRILNKLNLNHTWAPYNYKSLEEWIRSKHIYIDNNTLNSFFDKTSFSNELIELYRLPKLKKETNLLQWLRWNEFYGHMQRVLTKVDRMSMANSLEVRVPLLDMESIEFAWKSPYQSLNDKNELKKELKNCLLNYYPEELIQKQKKGFSVPIERWLRNELKNDVLKHVFKEPFYGKDLIKFEKVKTFVNDFYEEKHHNGWGVWHIYAWQKWVHCHIYN